MGAKTSAATRAVAIVLLLAILYRLPRLTSRGIDMLASRLAANPTIQGYFVILLLRDIPVLSYLL